MLDASTIEARLQALAEKTISNARQTASDARSLRKVADRPIFRDRMSADELAEIKALVSRCDGLATALRFDSTESMATRMDRIDAASDENGRILERLAALLERQKSILDEIAADVKR